MDDTGNDADMSAKDATHSITSDDQAAVKRAFSRLGIEIDDVGNSDSGAFIAALNDVADRLDKVGELEAENAKLTAAAEKVKTAPKASTPRTAQSLRKVGPPKVKAGEDDPLVTADVLLELIGAADTVEIAFSDGRSEIAGLSALEISGDAWKKTVAGLMLVGVDVLVHGPGHAQASYPLHGYGLLINGKQVAYSARPEVLNIGAGQQVNLSGDIVF
jgi:hypothetical protein